jgi:hypothetical protein
MVAPKKLSVKTREQNKKIANDIIKVVKSVAKEKKDDDVIEVKVEVQQVGHGMRPFGNHFDNDYIDYTINVSFGKMKVDGLGSNDVSIIGKFLKEELGKNFDIEDADLYFSYGNFTPDMVFPTYYRKFKKPCKEFTQLKKLVEKKYEMELGIKTLFSVYYGEVKYAAYNSNLCKAYIDQIKHYGSKKTGCMISKDKWGSTFDVFLK